MARFMSAGRSALGAFRAGHYRGEAYARHPSVPRQDLTKLAGAARLAMDPTGSMEA